MMGGITERDYVKITFQINVHPGVCTSCPLPVERVSKKSFWVRQAGEILRFSQRTGSLVGERPKQVPTHARKCEAPA